MCEESVKPQQGSHSICLMGLRKTAKTSGQLIHRHIFEPGISQIQSMISNHSSFFMHFPVPYCDCRRFLILWLYAHIFTFNCKICHSSNTHISVWINSLMKNYQNLWSHNSAYHQWKIHVPTSHSDCQLFLVLKMCTKLLQREEKEDAS